MRKTINLYVDDIRVCPEEFCIARTIEEALEYLEKYDIDILSLDHDLGEDECGKVRKTGYDLVKIICENNYRIKVAYLHTDNIVGKDNMFYYLSNARRCGILKEDMEIYPYPLVPNRWEPMD